VYDLRPLKAPVSRGRLLRLLARLAESPGTGTLLAAKFFGDIGIKAMRAMPVDDALPMTHQLPPGEQGAAGEQDPSGREQEATRWEQVAALRGQVAALRGQDSFRFKTAADIAGAYLAGDLDPEGVVQRVLRNTAELDRAEPPLRAMIAQSSDDLLEQAAASAKRYKAGAPLSPLDGVPVAIKDEVDMVGYPTTVGTAFLGREHALEDAEVVARLRAAGALLIGKANMHEIGLGVTGVNPHHGAARNPYDSNRATGGSSSGSAAAVAAGLCPIAVGADGGGSVRIPASLCGLVGLKATFGRISEYGAAPLCWSLAHIGPIAVSVADCALAYGIMAGADPKDPNTTYQPSPHLQDIGNADLTGIRLGLYQQWFEHADPDVVGACRDGIHFLEEAGAEVVPIEIPELGLLRTVHLITIVSEMASAHAAHYRQHRRHYGADTRLNLALAYRITNTDYIQAQRHRLRLRSHFAKVFETVDVIVTPTTGRTAPEISKKALSSGESNLALTDQIMRFAPAANLIGLPALSVPTGYDHDTLPVGLQIMGRPWEEHLLLRLGGVVDGKVRRTKPRLYRSVI
jgi:Asp-tRNA(Asn)/Glu-tRNA(Gln) amidotransferase A subunit family amidase